MRKAYLLAAILATSLTAQVAPSTPSAHAWSEDTHEEMARQAVLFMLRSSNPSLRFVGTVMASGGEGGKASPTGQRQYPLSEEARNVDHYNDVVLKNTASTPGGLGYGEDKNLFHEFMGNNFTAYNHFLLYENGGRDTSAWSYDTYSQDCEDLVYDEDLGELRARKAGDPASLCQVCGQAYLDSQPTFENAFSLPSNEFDVTRIDMGGKTYSCSEVWPSGKGKLWQDMHDNYGGYSIVLDDSLGGSIEEGGIPSDGLLLKMAGTHGNFKDFCEEAMKGFAGNADLISIPWYAYVFNPLLAIQGLILNETAKVAIDYAITEYLAPMCPSVEGYLDDSRAMFRYTNNSSTFEDEDFDKISMIDIRWHPVDNLVAYGREDFRTQLHTYHAPLPAPQTPTPPSDCELTNTCGVGGHNGIDPHKPRPLPNSGNLAPDNLQMANAAATIQEPTIGRLAALGRVLHGMSDLAVPGHITGHLLGAEHLVMEKGANHFVGLFNDGLNDTETASETGAVQGAGYEVGALAFTLDSLIDVDEANLKIGEITGDEALFNSSMERLAESAAITTRLAYQEDIATGRFTTVDDINGALRREYLTRAMVNNVVGAVHSMRGYYEEYGDREWDEIMEDVSWTASDAELIKAGPDFPVPGFVDVVVGSAGYSTYNLNIDSHYQEYVELSGCYVETHQWCNEEGGGDEWMPCGGVTPHTSGPPFLEDIDFTMGIVLSENNIGREGDEIHITGTFSNDATDVEYFRGSLSESAGQTIVLPASANEGGFAVWCTGSDLSQERIVVGDAQNTVHDPVCEIEELRPTNALDCNPQELAIWQSRAQTEWENAGRLPEYYGTLEPLPVGPEEGEIDQAEIDRLAEQFDASTAALRKALRSTEGKVVKVLDPSPWGRASFVWTDDKGLSNITTVKDNGGVITKRSTEPVRLRSKSGRK